jgi:hypothetical protein
MRWGRALSHERTETSNVPPTLISDNRILAAAVSRAPNRRALHTRMGKHKYVSS